MSHLDLLYYDVRDPATGRATTVPARDEAHARVIFWCVMNDGPSPQSEEERARLDTLDVREAGHDC